MFSQFFKKPEHIKGRQQFYTFLESAVVQELLSYRETLNTQISIIKNEYQKYEELARARSSQVQQVHSFQMNLLIPQTFHPEPFKVEVPWFVFCSSKSQWLSYLALQRQDLIKKIKSSMVQNGAVYAKSESEIKLYNQLKEDINIFSNLIVENFTTFLNNSSIDRLEMYGLVLKQKIEQVQISSECACLIELECVLATNVCLCQKVQMVQQYHSMGECVNAHLGYLQKQINALRTLRIKKRKLQAQLGILSRSDYAHDQILPGLIIENQQILCITFRAQLQQLNNQLASIQIPHSHSNSLEDSDPFSNTQLHSTKLELEQMHKASQSQELYFKSQLKQQMVKELNNFYEQSCQLYWKIQHQKLLAQSHQELPAQIKQYLPPLIKTRSEFYAFLRANSIQEFIKYQEKLDFEIKVISMEYHPFLDLVKKRNQDIFKISDFSQGVKSLKEIIHEKIEKQKELPKIVIPNHIYERASNQLLSELALQRSELMRKVETLQHKNNIVTKNGNEPDQNKLKTDEEVDILVSNNNMAELAVYEMIIQGKLKEMRDYEGVRDFFEIQNMLCNNGQSENMTENEFMKFEWSRRRDIFVCKAICGELKADEYEYDLVLPKHILMNEQFKKEQLHKQLAMVKGKLQGNDVSQHLSANYLLSD